MNRVEWKANGELAVGKGATVQEFMANFGADKLAIDVAPWGEGRLKVNGHEIAHVKDAKGRRRAFRELQKIAEHYVQTKSAPFEKPDKAGKLPAVKARLLEGKRGLVVGIANDQSIAWGCAKAFRALGAELAVTYLNDKAKKFVDPLAHALESQIVMPLDVRVPGQLEAVFERIGKVWGSLDFLVHSIAFSPKEALQGRVVDVSREGFLTTLDVSCWTFIRMAHLAEPLMRKGGTLFTMTYYGSQMVVKNYNIMGVAKAWPPISARREFVSTPFRPVRSRLEPPLGSRNSMRCWIKRNPKRLREAWSASTTSGSQPPSSPMTPRG